MGVRGARRRDGGVSKTGISGLGILAVALFAFVFPSTKQASGVVLPLLIFGDIIAATSYRTHAQWAHLWRIFPWTAAGVIVGFFTLGHITDRGARLLIGGIIVGLAALSYWRRYRASPGSDAPVHWAAGAAVGVLAGFVTLIANAAGPLMAIYLVSMRLPKMHYVGTAAMFFLVLNLFKVPFMAALGLVNLESLQFNLWLLPAVVAGAFLGSWMLQRINQTLFENLVLALSAASGLLLLW